MEEFEKDEWIKIDEFISVKKKLKDRMNKEQFDNYVNHLKKRFNDL